MKAPPIVSPQEWDVARQELLVEEKKLTRARDALAAKRRRMPWMAVEKEYRFDGPEGPVSLLDLFEGRRQLIVYRAFYAPDVTTYPHGGGERGGGGGSAGGLSEHPAVRVVELPRRVRQAPVIVVRRLLRDAFLIKLKKRIE